MTSMEYPDGEKIRYGYLAQGALSSVRSTITSTIPTTNTVTTTFAGK
jgi:YD repeat-containing protein